MFIHLTIHHPKSEHVDDMLASMHRVDQAASGAPGLIAIGAWRDQGSDRLVGLAQWESEEAFQAAAPRIFAAVADDPFDEWYEQPTESFRLTQP
jgi:hypothetical protein